MSTQISDSAPPILRLGHALAFVTFLRSIGAPADRLLQERGLAVYNDDPDTFVPLLRAWSFFDAAARTESPALGWHVGRMIGDHNLGAALRAKLENAPSLYDALRTLVRLANLEAPQLHLGLIERPNEIAIFTRYPQFKGVPGYAQSQAYQLGLFIDLIRHFAGESWAPPEIGIEQSWAPGIADELFPKSRVLTGQRMGFLTVPRAQLPLQVPRASRLAGGDQVLVGAQTADYAETLGALLEPYLAGGYPTAELGAWLMDTSVRTLARRLAERGTTYQKVVDRARFRVAVRLLRDPELRVTDVAIATGFDDSSNFTRMFRRVGGLTPKQFRDTVLAPD